RRIEIRKPYFPLPARLDWADLDCRDSLELVGRDPVELLTAWNAALEHLGIVELRPDDFPGRGKLDSPIHGHRHRLVVPAAGSRIKLRLATRKVLCLCRGGLVTVGSLRARPAAAEAKARFQILEYRSRGIDVKRALLRSRQAAVSPKPTHSFGRPPFPPCAARPGARSLRSKAAGTGLRAGE